MTDELDKLRAAFKAATPAPDDSARQANLRAAQEIFAARQGSATGARPVSESQPKTGWLRTGANTMLNTLTSRGALAATTALVTVTVVLMTPALREIVVPDDPLVKPELAGSTAEPVIEPEIDLTATDSDEGILTAGRAPTAAPVTEPLAEPADLGMREEEAMVMADSFAAAQEAPSASMLAARPPQAKRVVVGRDQIDLPEADTEAYANAEPNPLKVVAQDPVSTFSIDVDTASYSVIRSSLTAGQLPPRDAVRIEEMVNYFPYDYAAPEPGDAPFRPTVTVMDTPWNAGTDLIHIALQGELPTLDNRPPLDLVFLIDTSGSMQDADKLPLLIQSFRLMLGQLRPDDQVAIVTYAGSAGLVLDPTPAGERSKIIAALDNLAAGGGTAGQQGLEQAYAVAADMAEPGRIGRVILATDGDFNVGISDPEVLKEFIADKRDSGTFLSVLGFGRGNLDDATMQALAQNGNGQAAYIDTLAEAQKVLVDQLTGALFPIASDVKVQVEFNPAVIAEYRLIGYETRALNREDFNNDAVDAGDIGAGHTVTAIYEVTPVGSPAIRNDPLRYQAGEPVATNGSDELGFLRLRYKEPGEATSQLIELPIMQDMAGAGGEARFATAIAGFGELLRGSDALGSWGWGDAIALATANRGTDAFGYRTEAITLMRLAQSLDR